MRGLLIWAFVIVAISVNGTSFGDEVGERLPPHDSYRPARYVNELPTAETQGPANFVQGQPNLLIDSVGWVIGIPRKVLLWDRRVDNHQVTVHTQNRLHKYAAINELDDVKFRINQYDPIGEFHRLRQNKNVSAGWRYTLGSLHLIRYTVLPGRIWGGDEYNPYSNTVSVYSDIPEIGMVEAAYAKDVKSRELPGTYAAVQGLPGVSLWHATLATNDVLYYHSEYETAAEQEAAKSILAPYYGMKVGGAIGSFIPGPNIDPLLVAGGTVTGHILEKTNHSWVYKTETKYASPDSSFQLTNYYEAMPSAEAVERMPTALQQQPYETAYPSLYQRR
ncbi:MAG: hypothetical protein COA78_23830 [Blastopirellula sp.]|nr:MAG: hypothetical protein COA78_23830 [Blastopirellula sp.]